MSNTFRKISNLVSILAVVLLIGAFIVVLRSFSSAPSPLEARGAGQLASSPYPGSSSQQAPLSYPGPSSQEASSSYPGPSIVENGTIIVEQPSNQLREPVPTQIPIVAGAFRASETRLLSADWKLNIEQIFDDYVVHGDTLIARVRLKDRSAALVEIDLNDGSIHKLEEVRGFTEWRISERYAIWLTPVQESGIYEQILHVFDREKDTTFTLHRGKIEQIDLKGGWSSFRPLVVQSSRLHPGKLEACPTFGPNDDHRRFFYCGWG